MDLPHDDDNDDDDDRLKLRFEIKSINQLAIPLFFLVIYKQPSQAPLFWVPGKQQPYYSCIVTTSQDPEKVTDKILFILSSLGQV